LWQYDDDELDSEYKNALEYFENKEQE